MKKFFSALILLTIFVLPVAAENSMDVVLKGGIYASPYLNLNNNIFDVDLGFTLGGEVFYYPWEKTALGVGVDHLFDTDIENTAKKMNMTNIYLALKHKVFVFEDAEIDSVYLLGQAGLSTADIKLIDETGLAGICLGGGIGIEANHLVIEVLYTLANWMIKDNSNYDRGFLYSLKLNLGLKFSI